jgi:hypothetical protein
VDGDGGRLIVADLEDAAARAKQTTAALRDARAIVRRLDALVRSAEGGGVSSETSGAISAARDAAERVVVQLVRDLERQRRMARDAVVRATRTTRRD